MHRRTLVIAAAAARPALAQEAVLRGTAAYRERMALPPGAVLEVVLEEMGRADAPATRIAEARIAVQAQPPIPFVLAHDPARLDPRGTYALRATLSFDGRTQFRTDRGHRIRPGQDEPVALLLVRAAAATDAPPLAGPRWIAATIGGTAAAPGVVSDITFGADGAAHGTGGCNRIRGAWRLEGEEGIVIGPMASTMMACEPAKSGQERRFLDALAAARRWRIEAGRLVLRDAGGAELLRLRPG